jgi:hypothetical protein
VLSPVVWTIRLCSSWPSDDPPNRYCSNKHTPNPLRPWVDTGAGDRGGAPADFAVVADCRLSRGCWLGGPQVGESNLRTHGPKFRTFPSKVTRGLHPTPPSNPRVETPASPKAVTYPEGLVHTQHPAVPDAHPVVSVQSQSSTCEDARP